MEERREDRVDSLVKSASSQSNITLVLDEITVAKKRLLQPGVEVADVSTAGGHVEDHHAQQEQD